MKYYMTKGPIIHLPSIRHIKLSGFAKILLYYHGVDEAEVIEFNDYDTAKKEFESLWLALINMKEV